MTNEQAKKVISLINEKIRLSQNEELSVMDRLTSISCYDYEVENRYYDAMVKRCISTIIFNREVKNCT